MADPVPWIHLPFSEMELSLLSLFFLSQQGERDLPEISRRELDLLVAEEGEAILLEGRPIWQHGARLALDSQAPDMGSLGPGSAPISSLLHSEP